MEYNIRSGAVADVVEVSGRIAASESMDLIRRLQAHLGDNAARPLVIDLGQVDYMSSAGLSMAIRIEKRLREAKQGFAIVGLRDRVAQVFKLSGIDRILPIYPDLAAAEAAIEAMAGKAGSPDGADAGQPPS